MKKNNFIALLILAAISLTSVAQDLKTPVASPKQTLKQNFAIGEISIDYSRPGVKGRVIYGEVVPFDKVWRTGANASTKLTLSDNVKVEGNPVPAGTYSLFTIPGKTEWTIILNKNLVAGALDYKEADDFLRFKAKPTVLNDKVETFTINVADITTTSANIELLWEKTRVAFNISESIDSTVMKNIETALAADRRPYYQSASYYYDNGKDLNKALEYVNKAIEQNPKAFYMVNLKAKIQLKLKDYKGAIASAEQSTALAKEAKNEEFVKMNEKLIEEAKKGK
jgi:hypothetical protein